MSHEAEIISGAIGFAVGHYVRGACQEAGKRDFEKLEKIADEGWKRDEEAGGISSLGKSRQPRPA